MGTTGAVLVRMGAVAVLLAGAGCAEMGDDELAQLKTRASFDFDCPKSQIKTVTIDDRTKGVSGCGRRATYVQSCQRVSSYSYSDEECTWVLNSHSRHDDEGE